VTTKYLLVTSVVTTRTELRQWKVQLGI